jgi:enoyl-CoA hydratase/carnithine racemase
MRHLTKPHTLAEIEKLMERDYFLDAQQALEMGLVDKVLTSREEQERVTAPLKSGTDGTKTSNEKGAGGKGSTDGGSDGPHPNPSPRPSPS